MNDQPVLHNTFVIRRVYRASRVKVFAAFAEADKKRRWFAEGHHAVEHYEMEFKVGGAERVRMRLDASTPFPGLPLATEGVFLDIVPQRRIVAASSMTFGDNRISASLVTFEFLAKGEQTELIFTHQGAFFEGADGPKMREEGWRELFEQLAAEVSH
jgi:uncharacterized protein YndB with AHSA1/START domain